MNNRVARLQTWLKLHTRWSTWYVVGWGLLAFWFQYVQIPYVFNLQDDFWLWYGVQRFAAGEIPILDFQSYDVGRYALTFALGFGQDTLFGVRLAQAIIGAVVVATGMWFLYRKVDAHIGIIGLTFVALSAWLFLRHKYYDIAISVANVVFVWHLLVRQTRTMRWLAGPMVVISWLINRNHALYLVLALGLWVVWQYVALPRAQRITWSHYIDFALGGVVAIVVAVTVAALIPGYIDAYYRNNILIFWEAGTTNLSRPTVWPWQLDWSTMTTIKGLREVLFSWMLVLLLGVGGASVLWELRYTRQTGQMRASMLAPALFILPYSHHVFSRTSVTHYAQGVFPLLLYLAVATMAAQAHFNQFWRRVAVWLIYIAWVVASLLVTYPQQPLVRCAQACVSVRLDENMDFYTDAGTRNDFVLLQTWLESYDATQSFAVYSQRPGLYAINHVDAPVYHTYIAYATDESTQRAEIQDIESHQVRMIIISKQGVDGAKTAFRATNPLTFAHIQKHYTVVEYTKHYEAYLRNPTSP